MPDEQKLHPRNETAWQHQRVSGNPVTTMLQSGVGNCFPGLECDIRNLERRFFPFLAVDLIREFALIVEIDVIAARNAVDLSPAQLSTYEMLARDTADLDLPFWFIRTITGNFGPFGNMQLNLDEVGQPGRPADAWTAVRLIPQGEAVTLQLSLGLETNARTATLTGARQAYLDDTGALNASFQTGEMTQSLCSPWTHDFRDCGCFYWASNHPDIAQIQDPIGAPPDPAIDQMVAWQRTVKGSISDPPEPAQANRRSREMAYYEINNRWQELAVVLDGREQAGAFSPSEFLANPFPDIATLIPQLRYAAGVELGVMLEYLTAAFSLRRDAQGDLADDIRAVNAELMRVAIGEMRHLRVVNDILRELSERQLAGPYEPALQVAAELPSGGGNTRPLVPRPLTGEALTDFIDIERPSFSVDGLYGRILATLRRDVPGPLADAVATIMTEGAEHFETFSFIQEWLRPHAEAAYLIQVQDPNPANQLHQDLQGRYLALLDNLFIAYELGIPAGAERIATARAAMLSSDGIQGACDALADAGLLVVFDTPNDSRFQPIPRP